MSTRHIDPLRDESGQNAVEYALVLVLVSLAMAGAVAAITGSFGDLVAKIVGLL
jgi:Flp pilus assembly pilin Flp